MKNVLKQELVMSTPNIAKERLWDWSEQVSCDKSTAQPIIMQIDSEPIKKNKHKALASFSFAL